MKQTQPSTVYKLSHSQAILNRTSLGFSLDIRKRSRTGNAQNDSNTKESLHFPTDPSMSSYLSPKDSVIIPSPLLGSPSPSRRLNKSPNYGRHLLMSPKTSQFRKSPNIDTSESSNYFSRHMLKTQPEFSREEKPSNILEPNTEKNYIDESFRAKLMSRFVVPPRERATATIFFGRTPKSVSIKHAERILQSFFDDLKAQEDEKIKEFKTKIEGKATIDEKTRLDIRQRLETKINYFISCVVDLVMLCQNAIANRNLKGALDQQLKKMFVSSQGINPELALYCLYIKGKVCLARSDFREAVNEFRHFKDLCASYKLTARRIDAYKMLGKCYQALKYHKTALIYFTKFLYVAWETDSPKAELLAYDYIGIQYYYMGNLEKAEFYHNRMVNGKLEPKTSRFRQIGIVKIKADKPNYSYGKKMIELDSDFELGAHFVQGNSTDFNQDEAGGEISHRDEGFEPPVSNPDEEYETRKAFEMMKKNKLEVMRIMGVSQKPVTLKTIPGFMKAKVGLGQKGDKTRKAAIPIFRINQTETFNPLSESKTTSKVISRASTYLTGKPNEQIFTSHLSRNRGLKNFAYFSPNHSVYQENEIEREIDSKSSEQIKKILERVKANLEVMKECLLNASSNL